MEVLQAEVWYQMETWNYKKKMKSSRNCENEGKFQEIAFSYL